MIVLYVPLGLLLGRVLTYLSYGTLPLSRSPGTRFWVES